MAFNKSKITSSAGREDDNNNYYYKNIMQNALLRGFSVSL